jgi:hypothetical protein
MTNQRRSRTTSSRTLVQQASLAVGAVFLLVGVLGFVPGVTSHYDTMEFAAHHSGARLFDVFQVSVLHNVVHLLFGVLGVAMARTASNARVYLLGGGIAYLLLFVYGVLIDRDSGANFVPVNTADNWLHLILGLGMVGLGLVLGRRGSRTATS